MTDLMLSLARAFLVGGLVCLFSQILIDKTKLTPARILVLLVVTGVILNAVGLFQPLREFGGAGVTTPLLGFGGLIADGVREAVDRQGLLGAFTGGLTATAGGISAALIFGYVASLLTRGKPKR